MPAYAGMTTGKMPVPLRARCHSFESESASGGRLGHARSNAAAAGRPTRFARTGVGVKIRAEDLLKNPAHLALSRQGQSRASRDLSRCSSHPHASATPNQRLYERG